MSMLNGAKPLLKEKPLVSNYVFFFNLIKKLNTLPMKNLSVMLEINII